MDIETLKYPIGKFKPPWKISPGQRLDFIEDLASLPDMLFETVSGLTEAQLDTPYRPQGWTVRQVIHHLPDSHAHSYIRFKWALTEQQPLIKAYDETRWAEMIDSQTAPPQFSLQMLKGLHGRWVWLLKNIKDSDWSRCFVHPETKKHIPLDFNLALYAWHGKHHHAHITSLIIRKGW